MARARRHSSRTSHQKTPSREELEDALRRAPPDDLLPSLVGLVAGPAGKPRAPIPTLKGFARATLHAPGDAWKQVEERWTVLVRHFDQNPHESLRLPPESDVHLTMFIVACSRNGTIDWDQQVDISVPRTVDFLRDAHNVWKTAGGHHPHPIAPLVRAWLATPLVEAETRVDKRILPRIRVSEHPEREAGMLFGGLHEGRRVEAPELPFFSEAPPEKQVPILDLVDAAGVPIMARGKGVPLACRLFVRPLLTIKPDDRALPTVRLVMSLRELVAGLFPTDYWRPSRHWPKLRHALMHARDYSIHDGQGRWFPLAVRYMPDAPSMDDRVIFDIAFPPGAGSGPTVDMPAMDLLSVKSAPRWRAYIGAHSVAWRPGVTRVPGPNGRFVWAHNPDAYPILTNVDRRRIAFGADRKHRTQTEIDKAFRGLPGLVVLEERVFNPRTGEVGWRVVPKDAAAAISATSLDRATGGI